MQRHHTGSGRRRVIPADWSAHHRGILAGTRGATVELRHAGGGTTGTFNRETGKYEGGSAPTPYYTGPARIQIAPAEQQEQVAVEQELTTLAYFVMLDHAVTGCMLDDVVTVAAVDDNGDQELEGKSLQVSSIESGSLHWERRLKAVLDIERPSS